MSHPIPAPAEPCSYSRALDRLADDAVTRPAIGPTLRLSFDEALDRLDALPSTAWRSAVRWMHRTGQVSPEDAFALTVLPSLPRRPVL